MRRLVVSICERSRQLYLSADGQLRRKLHTSHHRLLWGAFVASLNVLLKFHKSFNELLVHCCQLRLRVAKVCRRHRADDRQSATFVLDALLEVHQSPCDAVDSLRVIYESGNEWLRLPCVGGRSRPNGKAGMAALVHFRCRSTHRCVSLMDPFGGDLSASRGQNRWGFRPGLLPSERTAGCQRNRSSRTLSIRADDFLLQTRWLRGHVLSNLRH